MVGARASGNQCFRHFLQEVLAGTDSRVLPGPTFLFGACGFVSQLEEVFGNGLCGTLCEDFA